MSQRIRLKWFLLISGAAHFALLSGSFPVIAPMALPPGQDGVMLNALLMPLQRQGQFPAANPIEDQAANEVTSPLPEEKPVKALTKAATPHVAINHTGERFPQRINSPQTDTTQDTARSSIDGDAIHAPLAAEQQPTSEFDAVTDSRSQTSDNTQISQWQSRLRGQLIERMQQQFRYPLLAQRRGWQGVVKLRFVVTREGYVSSVELAESSGHPVLDNSALASAQKIQDLKETLDSAFSVAPVRIEIPVRFVLQG